MIVVRIVRQELESRRTASDELKMGRMEVEMVQGERTKGPDGSLRNWKDFEDIVRILDCHPFEIAEASETILEVSGVQRILRDVFTTGGESQRGQSLVGSREYGGYLRSSDVLESELSDAIKDKAEREGGVAIFRQGLLEVEAVVRLEEQAVEMI